MPTTPPSRPQRSALGLLVLWQLFPEPMHVYRMQKLFEAEGKDRIVNVRSRASLYQTIERLQRNGLVEVAETTHQEGYPDRTVYALTDAGRDAAQEWLREMLSETGGEYPEFIVALSLLFGLPVEEARAQLELRAERIATQLTESKARARGRPARAAPAVPARGGVPRGDARDRARVAARCHRRPGGRADHVERGVAAPSLRDVSSRSQERRGNDDGDRGSGAREAIRQDASRSMGSTWRPRADRSSRCLVPTAPARRRSCARWRRCSGSMGACCNVAGHDVARDPGAVRRVIGLAGQFAAIEPAMTGRENLEMVARLFGHGPASRAAQRRRRPRTARSARRRAVGWPARIPAACGGGSTWARAWSGLPACCCSTSRPPALTRAVGSSCGRPSGTWSRPAPTCCSPPSTSTRPITWPSQIVIIDHGRAGGDRHPGRAQGPDRRERDRAPRPQRGRPRPDPRAARLLRTHR